MQNIKYILMSIFLLNSFSIFSMKEEIIDIKNINEKTKLLVNKPKSLVQYQDKSLSENLNQINLDDFIKTLPKEIWNEIISYLNYEENRKVILQFLVLNFDLDDFTAKKIAIDLYRTVLLNSKSLSDYKNVTKEAFKSWNNKSNKKLVADYLDIISNNFNLNENYKDNLNLKVDKLSKEELLLKILSFKLNSLKDNEGAYRFDKFKFRVTPFELHSTQNRLDLKKATAFFCAALTVFIVFSILVFLPESLSSSEFMFALSVFFGFPCMISGCFLVFIIKNFCISPDISFGIISKANFFNKLDKEIKEYLKKNNLSLSDTDSYFLKILGHESKVEEITDLEIV